MIKLLAKVFGMCLISFAIVSGLAALGVVVVPTVHLVFGFKEIGALITGVAFAIV